VGKRSKAVEIEQPPPEQQRGDAFAIEIVTDKGRGGATIRIGKAYRRRSMIDILAERGVLNPDDAKALRHYRHHAIIAERSPVRDSLARHLPGRTGDGPGIIVLNAIRIRDDCNRAAGSLRDILRAVAIEDCSLSEWAMARAGAIENCRKRRGRLICQLEPRPKALAVAKMEIQIAASRVRAELDA